MKENPLQKEMKWHFLDLISEVIAEVNGAAQRVSVLIGLVNVAPKMKERYLLRLKQCATVRVSKIRIHAYLSTLLAVCSKAFMKNHNTMCLVFFERQ
jgi:hypothetical protein